MSEYGLFDDGSAADPGYVPRSAFVFDPDADDAALGAAMRAASSGPVGFGATSSGGTFAQSLSGVLNTANSGLRTLSDTIRSFNTTRTDIARSNAQAAIDQANLNAATDAARRRAQSIALGQSMPLATQLASMLPMLAVVGVIAYGVSRWRK
jgi:hypothetical protein